MRDINLNFENKNWKQIMGSYTCAKLADSKPLFFVNVLLSWDLHMADSDSDSSSAYGSDGGAQ